MSTHTDLPNVGLAGKMGSGKSTVAQYLTDAYGYQRLHFAELLKVVAAQIWGQDAVHHNRDRLQQFGAAVREIDPDAWVNALLRDVAEAMSDSFQPIVIDDVRFPNEYFALSSSGFRFARVQAATETRVDRLMAIDKLGAREQLDHVSETALDHIAFTTLINGGDHDVLYAQVDQFLNIEQRRTA